MLFQFIATKSWQINRVCIPTDGPIKSASTKAYCNPIYDHSNLEDESGNKSVRSESDNGSQKGIVKIDVEVSSEPILAGIEKDQVPQVGEANSN